MPLRLSPALATLIALSGAGGMAWLGAGAAAHFIEERSAQDVSLALRAGGLDWTQVATDGLRVTLSGTAPTEVERFRAMTAAAGAVDATRVIDAMTVAVPDTMTPPEFEVELLRNDDGIQLIGLVPAATDRLDLVRHLRDETAAPQVADLLESADHPVPEGWDEALQFGMTAAQMAARSKISIAAGMVNVTALADSPAERARLETGLAQARPASVALTMNITAPRPVIAPFTLRFRMDADSDADGPHFEACAADTEAARDRILTAAEQAGARGQLGCTLGLGAPSPDWAAAVVAAIETVAALGTGTVTLSDADVVLIVPATVTAARFDEAAGRLENRLPSVFSLQTVHETAATPAAGPAEFTATLGADGTLALRGRITDDRMRDAVDSVARARFARVDSSLRTDADVPGGWTVRVIAGIEAMGALASGSVTVTPDVIRLNGTSGDASASTRTAAVLSQRLGAGARYELAIRYDKRLDKTLGLPDGAECVADLNTIMAESAIGFEPNKSAIAGDPAATLTKLAEVMGQCGDFQIEIGGHTDSQGSEGFNADLSRARAQAILAALAGTGAPTANMTARGYGESQPIASNDTDAGREANRRIEFKLLSEMPVRSEPLPAPRVVAGVTGEAVMPPATAGLAAPPIDPGALPMNAAPPPGMIGPVQPAQQGVVTVPGVVGAPEQVQGPTEGVIAPDNETARVPVLTPEPGTPRPAPRPVTPANP